MKHPMLYCPVFLGALWVSILENLNLEELFFPPDAYYKVMKRLITVALFVRNTKRQYHLICNYHITFNMSSFLI